MRKSHMIKAQALLLIGVLLAGCSTVAGAGRDIQSAGHAVTTEANRAQADM